MGGNSPGRNSPGGGILRGGILRGGNHPQTLAHTLIPSNASCHGLLIHALEFKFCVLEETALGCGEALI